MCSSSCSRRPSARAPSGKKAKRRRLAAGRVDAAGREDSLPSTPRLRGRRGRDDVARVHAAAATTPLASRRRGSVAAGRPPCAGDNCIDTHSWAKLAAVGGQIRRIQPSFDARDLGFERIGDLYKATGLFELQTDRWGVVTIRLLEDGLLPRFSAPRPAEPRRKQLV